MSDLTITVASVAPHTGANYPSILARGTAGATITAGQSLYLDSATSTLKLADADLSTAAAYGVGIAMHAALSGQPIQYITGGFFTPGATLTKGGVYTVSATAGGICPIADLTTGAHPCILFYAISTTVAFVIVANMVDTSLAQITL
jgi:hypothetical protein